MTLRIELDLGPEREAAVQARADGRGVSLAELVDRALAQEAGYPGPRRVEARLQEVNARLVLHDGRFAAAGDRVNQTDRRLETLSSRLNDRLAAVTRRADALDDRSERVERQLGAWSGQAHTIEQRLGLTMTEVPTHQARALADGDPASSQDPGRRPTVEIATVSPLRG